jgi:hypothetical protein
MGIKLNRHYGKDPYKQSGSKQLACQVDYRDSTPRKQSCKSGAAVVVGPRVYN